MGLLPIFSTAIADMQIPSEAADIKLLLEHNDVAINAKSASPAPETSTGFTDKAGKLCLLILLEDIFS